MWRKRGNNALKERGKDRGGHVEGYQKWTIGL